MNLDQQPNRRRFLRIRFSLRSLMLLVLASGCWLGWYFERVRSQQAAVAAIVKSGGTFEYDWTLGHYIPDIIEYKGRPRVPQWVATHVGEGYIADITYVSLHHRPLAGTGTADDETLRRVSRLSRLETLGLFGTNVTDEGLAHIKQLTSLKDLDLRSTRIGDAGLNQLSGMTSLRLLNLAGTRVTNEGVLALEESLPDLQILREEDMSLSTFGPRVGADLDFARTQPVRTAIALLLYRARLMAANRDSAQLIATIGALYDLEANDAYTLLKLAGAHSECLRILEPQWSTSLTSPEREALTRRCAERGIAALSMAVDRGYDNFIRLEGDARTMRTLWNLRDRPGFAEIVARIKARRAVTAD